MTLINSWWETDRSAGHEVLRGLVQCDECVDRFRISEPAPRSEESKIFRTEPTHPVQALRQWSIGSPEFFRDLEWHFEDFESGPHVCPACHRARRKPLLAPIERPALPNLLIIGAAKCGTTSLHRYLGMHPLIHMSDPKELNFFQDPECLNRLSTYASFFDGSVPVRGEASVIYTYHPIAPAVPERVRSAIPGAKLIYLVRDPVERLLSYHVELLYHAFYMNHSHLDLEAAARDYSNPYNQYMVASRYATQLERYLDVFPSEQLLVVDQADLRERRRETLRRVFRFLEVDQDFDSPEFEELHRTAGKRRRGRRSWRRLSESRLADMVRAVPPGPREALVAPVRRIMTTQVKQPEIDEELRRCLRDALRDEARRLREMTGEDFPAWQV